jgi:hypothetical protein
MSQQSSGDMQSGFLNNLNDAIRENPVAAGLVGAGICWMLLRKVKAPALGGVADALKGAANSMGAAASAGGSSAAAGANAVGSRVAEAASGLKDMARDTLSAVTPGDISHTVSEARSNVVAGLRSTASTGKRYGRSAQQMLSENLDRQPLLLGAIGLAIGAGIASAFSSTRIEDELMGEQGAAAREKLQAFADETREFATNRAREVLDVVKDEAAAQGLTPDGAREAVRDLSQKVKDVAGAAREAVTSRVS